MVAAVAGELSDALAARELALPASSALAVRGAAETGAAAAVVAAVTSAVAVVVAACMSSTRYTFLATEAAEAEAPRSLSLPRETLAAGKVGKTQAVTVLSSLVGDE